ncbi:MAG: hypothetical protein NZ955_01855 [Candidatus Bathyarchaeota archaeon]|nr:hypothetical protein [Candidatus Bathyarchaeota archaeon]
MQEFKLPRRLSWERLCQVLVSYLNAGADREYISVKDVAERAGVDEKNVSRNNAFFKSWGFIEESKDTPKKYKLAEDAIKFVAAYRIDPDSDVAKRALQNLLMKNEVVMSIVERIEAEGFDRRRLMAEIPSIVGDAKVDLVGIQSFLDMLNYAFEWEGVETKKLKPVEQVREKKKPRREAIRRELPVTKAGVNLQLQLVFIIDQNTDMEKLALLFDKIVYILGFAGWKTSESEE